MLSVAAVVAALFIGFTMLQTPKFTGIALVMISPEHGDIVAPEPAAAAGVNPDAGTIESQIEIILARKLIGQLVDRLKLVEDPAWNGRCGQRAPSRRSSTRSADGLRPPKT